MLCENTRLFRCQFSVCAASYHLLFCGAHVTNVLLSQQYVANQIWHCAYILNMIWAKKNQTENSAPD